MQFLGKGGKKKKVKEEQEKFAVHHGVLWSETGFPWKISPCIISLSGGNTSLMLLGCILL